MDEERKLEETTVAELIVELQKRVTELEIMFNNLQGFMKNQIQINEFFRRIVDVKYSKDDLVDIYNKYEEMHKNNTNLKNSEENCEAPDENDAKK